LIIVRKTVHVAPRTCPAPVRHGEERDAGEIRANMVRGDGGTDVNGDSFIFH
jgi:hypothetical protein